MDLENIRSKFEQILANIPFQEGLIYSNINEHGLSLAEFCYSLYYKYNLDYSEEIFASVCASVHALSIKNETLITNNQHAYWKGSVFDYGELRMIVKEVNETSNILFAIVLNSQITNAVFDSEIFPHVAQKINNFIHLE